MKFLEGNKMNLKELTIRKPDDFHCHLRSGEMLADVSWRTANQFKRALVMPNIIPPVLTGKDAIIYSSNFSRIEGFEPLMTIQITRNTTKKIIREASKSKVVAGKLYPEGVTNSENGVKDFEQIYPIFEEMQKVGMILSIHGELIVEGDIFCLDGEKRFSPILEKICKNFPALKIVMEHISTKEVAELIKELPKNVAATITAHHLELTLNDVIGDRFYPHNFCKPIVKGIDDRTTLLECAMSGNSKFFFGSDSAPHPLRDKECSSVKAGVFSSPVALPLLTEIFEKYGNLVMLQDFVSSFGADFYGLPRNTETITLIGREWTVPLRITGLYETIVPLMAGKKLSWQVK